MVTEMNSLTSGIDVLSQFKKGSSMKQVICTRKKAKKEEHKFPTVGEMLEYIKANNISMDAEIIIEHVNDVYIREYHWTHYFSEIKKGYDKGTKRTFLPVHNGFGSTENGKYFVLWMHY